jgi:hypothetical protein
MSIAAFEVGAGCGRLAIVWFINLSLLALAVVVHPRVAFAGFVRGRRTASIYSSNCDATTLGAMSVESVRAMLRVDATDARPRLADRALFALWAVVAFIVFLAPLAIVLSALWALVRMLLR